MNRSNLFLVTAAMVVAGAFATDANAVTSPRNWVSHGPGNCQGALPSYEGAIRKRPQAVANEGATTAFVTCDFDNIDNLGTGFNRVVVGYRNTTGTPLIVTCSLVNGFFSMPGATVLTKSAIAPAVGGPEGGRVLIEWTAVADNAGENFGSPALSCQIPAGTEIGGVGGDFTVDVGT